MQPSQRVSFDRGFQTLFEDGVHLLLSSESEKDNDTANSLARGSIACTMMLPEVGANICIESLNLESSVFKEIDKLAPLAKFDFFLRTNFRGKKLPTGVLPLQKAQELKRLRDAFVHPKKQPVLWTDVGDNTEHGVSERTQFLDMSKNPSMWCSSDAESAMRGTHEFLGYISVIYANTPRFERHCCSSLMIPTFLQKVVALTTINGNSDMRLHVGKSTPHISG